MFRNPKDKELKSGEIVWQYEIEKHLGKGAFGDVYLAHHRVMTKRQVAIKRLKMSEANQSTIKRFIHESFAMGELYHPNIVLIFELIEPGKYPDVDSYYIVMEYLDGGTLKDWVDRDDQPLASLPVLVRVIQEVLRGLEVAHQENIFHRDIKPENILLSRDGSRVKIGDWGLAHLDEHRMTVVGDVMGTLCYMPPEQAGGQSGSVDGRADLYSVGVMLYEMITGHLCLDFQQISESAVEQFLRRDPAQFGNRNLLRQVAREACYRAIEELPRTDPSVYLPDITPAMRSLLNRAVAPRPEDRFQTAREFITALDSVSKPTPGMGAKRTTVDERSTKVATLLVQAREQRQQRCYDEAIHLLNEARSIVEGDAGVSLELARIYNLMGRRKEAVQILTEALKRNPENHVLLRDLGIAYMGLKDNHQAREALEQSLRLNPNQSQVEKLLHRLNR